jgi:molybdate transport system substrate-binding protein
MKNLLLVPLLLLAGFSTALADTLKVLTAGAFKPVVMDLIPDFEKQTGHKVTVINDTAGALNQRIRTGDPFDIVIAPTTTLEPLAAEGKVFGESVTPLGKVGIGVAVALGARQPNIGNVEGLRRTLLDARTVAYVNPSSGGTSGIYVERMFQSMGILSDMRRKAVLANGGLAGEKVARGEAEIALQQASELRLVPSIRFAGMLPEGVQNWTVYAGALSLAARNKDSALTLMSILADQSIDPILKKRGLEAP